MNLVQTIVDLPENYFLGSKCIKCFKNNYVFHFSCTVHVMKRFCTLFNVHMILKPNGLKYFTVSLTIYIKS